MLGLNMALQARQRYQVSGSYYTHPVAHDGMAAIKLDLASFEEAEKSLRRLEPDVVVHTAGLTSVEACEADPEMAYRLNVQLAEHTARVADRMGAKLVHISTDHLFDGQSPWKREQDTPYSLNVYARTKLEAEKAVLQGCSNALVVRTKFFGWGTPVRTSFSDWILQSLAQGRELTMFSDVFFTPILIDDLVDLILRLVERGATGVFNVAGGTRLSKHDFALKLAGAFSYPTDGIRSISVEGYPFTAPRPRDMSLNSDKTQSYLGVQMPNVEDGLRRLVDLKREGRHHVLEEAMHIGHPMSGVPGVEV